MIRFSAIIKKHGEQGEKTGWTYIDVPASIANQLFPNNKKAFRVKGKLDDVPVEKISVTPVGGGDFILPLNATVRKKLGKGKGGTLQVQLTLDENKLPLPPDFIECLADEPGAKDFFNTLPMSHQNYFVRYLTGVKGAEAQAKRMAAVITALSQKQHLGEMMRSLKEKRLKQF